MTSVTFWTYLYQHTSRCLCLSWPPHTCTFGFFCWKFSSCALGTRDAATQAYGGLAPLTPVELHWCEIQYCCVTVCVCVWMSVCVVVLRTIEAEALATVHYSPEHCAVFVSAVILWLTWSQNSSLSEHKAGKFVVDVLIRWHVQCQVLSSACTLCLAAS